MCFVNLQGEAEQDRTNFLAWTMFRQASQSTSSRVGATTPPARSPNRANSSRIALLVCNKWQAESGRDSHPLRSCR